MSYWNTLKCHNRHCRKEFRASRRDAKYCSAKCRKAASNERKRLQSLIDATIGNVNQLREYLEEPGFEQIAGDGLKKIFEMTTFTDKAPGAAQRSGSAATRTPSVHPTAGTNGAGADKREHGGDDTSSAVQPSVKSLDDEYTDLCERLDKLEAEINFDMFELAKRINELEEATDWSMVS